MIWRLQYVWDRMLGGFKHKNNRTREAVCFCLISTLNMCVSVLVQSACLYKSACNQINNFFPIVDFFRYGARGLTLSKIVPHICGLLGDPTSQVYTVSLKKISRVKLWYLGLWRHLVAKFYTTKKCILVYTVYSWVYFKLFVFIYFLIFVNYFLLLLNQIKKVFK